MLSTLAVCAALMASSEGLPKHPRIFLNGDELAFLREHRNHDLYREAWNIVEGEAEKADGPRISRSFRFGDIDTLYSDTKLGGDSTDIYYLGLAYGLTQRASFATKAANIFRHDLRYIDVSYQSKDWWYSVKWNILGTRMMIGLDMIWPTLSAADKAEFSQWLATLSNSVRTLHEKGTNTGYYADNGAGGNIKAWDNALIGLTGFLIGDWEMIQYALEGEDNDSTESGDRIELNFRSQIRNGIVDVTSGANSQYGPHRILDWHRTYDKGLGTNEDVGYPAYHHLANDLLCRAALRHGLDFYRLGARGVDGESRHHMYQVVDRMQQFVLMDVPAADNSWRTQKNGNWVYSDDDKYLATRAVFKLTGISDEITAPLFDPIRNKMDARIGSGIRNHGNYVEYHVLRFAWPLLRINRVKGTDGAGSLKGDLVYEGSGSADAHVFAVSSSHPLISLVETPIEVNGGGFYSARHLPVGKYFLIARRDGFKSAFGLTKVLRGDTSQVGDISMHRGEHEIAPRSMDHVTRQQVGRVRFSHRDPDNLDTLDGFCVFLEIGTGDSSRFFDLTTLVPDLFEIEESDNKNLVLSLDVSRMKFPDNEAKFWFIAKDTESGTLFCDRARYRFK